MRLFATIGLLVLVSAVKVCGQMSIEPPVNPTVYTAPSGHYKLRVNPDVPNASTGATYRLTLDDRLVWEKHFSFALQRAGVTDDGLFGGYAIRETKIQVGEIVIVIGKSNGNISLSEVHNRRPAIVADGLPEPEIAGLIFSADQDRMTVRVIDGPWVKRREEWWTYRLSDAKPGATLTPMQYMGKEAEWIADARPVKGTPLTLLSWWLYDGNTGAILTLVDSAAKPLWRLDLKGDYEVSSDEFKQADSDSEFQKSGSMLAVKDKMFDIRVVSKRQRVTYRVESNSQGWTVTEVARTPFQAGQDKALTFQQLPGVHLQMKRKWTIPLQKLPDSPIHDVEGFELVDNNWIATLRGGEAPALILSDRHGGRAETIKLPMLLQSEYPGNHLTWLGGKTFVVTHTPKKREESSKAWVVDFSTRRTLPFADFGSRRVSAIASFRDGRIVVLAQVSHPYTSDDILAFYGRNGCLKSERSTAGGYGGRLEDLLSPEDVAVDSNGRVVVLDIVRNKLQIFSPGNKYLFTIALPKSEVNDYPYATNIRCVNKGYLIWESPSAYLLNDVGGIRSKFEPRFTNSKPLDSRCDPQLDEKGRLWISDGDAIYRLDRSSVVDRTVGRVGGVIGLRQVSSLIVTPDGSTIVRDKTSDEVHKFNPAGADSATLRPLKTELADSAFAMDEDLTEDDLGRVYVHYPSGYVRYSASGHREAVINAKGEGGPPPAVWNSGWWWNRMRLLDERGNTVTTISRLPNGDWLEFLDGTVAFSPEGAVAVMFSGNFPSKRTSPLTVGFYGRTGLPKSMITIPGDAATVSHFSYDGNAVYFTRNDDILAFDTKGKGLWRFVLPLRKGARWQVFPSRKGLAAFDGFDTVYWYAIPNRVVDSNRFSPRALPARTPRHM